MRIPFVAAAVPLAAALLAAACSGGGKTNVGPLTPTEVTVYDVTYGPQAGIDLVSSKSGVVVATTKTGSDGKATIDVAQDGEVTAHFSMPNALSFTRAALNPGQAIVIPIAGTPPPPNPTIPQTVDFSATFTPVDGLLTQFDAAAGTCGDEYVGTIGAAVTSFAIALTDDCRQSDGTFSIWATANESGASPTYYGAVLDLPGTRTTAGTIALLASNATTTFPVELTSLPPGLDAIASGADLIPIRKGAPIGPDLSTQVVSVNGSASLSFALMGLPNADAVDLELDIGTPISGPAYSRWFLSRIVLPSDAHAWDATPFSRIPPDLALHRGPGGRPTVTFTAPAESKGDALSVTVAWMQNGDGHTWVFWMPVPAPGAAVSVTLPPVPSSLAAYRAITATSMNVALDTIDADFTTGYSDFTTIYTAPPALRTIADTTTLQVLAPQ